jgi:hypothetical protein
VLKKIPAEWRDPGGLLDYRFLWEVQPRLSRKCNALFITYTSQSMLRLVQTFLLGFALLVSACSFFSPNEPEAFGDLRLALQFPESAPGFSLNKAQALDRVLIVISEPESPQNPNGREIARREFLIGNERSVRVALRVPLRKDIDNCFTAEVTIFDRLDLLYTGQGFPCFGPGQRSASAQIDLETAAFFVAQPLAALTTTSTRLTPITVQLRDSTITHFEIVTDSVRALVSTLGRRADLITTPAFVLGDTSTVKIRAWRNLDFKGEAHRGFVYTGPKADVLIAMTWNSPSDFDLEVINPVQQAISVNAPGDSVGGSGFLVLSDANGFGPELFEWRQSARITQGTFTINARRSAGNLLGAGNVYVYLREGRANQSLRVAPFDFKLLELELIKQVHVLTWP